MKLNKQILKNMIQEVIAEDSLRSMILEGPQTEGRGRGQKEGGHKRVMGIIGPGQPDVKQFGIMTSENPMGQESSSFDNQRRLKRLQDALKKEGYAYDEIKGRFFNNDENSLVIPNIDMRSLASLASHEDWPQHSFIYGKKDKMADDVVIHYYFVELRYDDSYDMTGYEVTDYRTSIFKGGDIQSRTDMFSEKGGKKFYIPFFDDTEQFDDEEQVVPAGPPPNPTNP